MPANKKTDLEIQSFKELTISGWYNELEGIGYNIDLAREKVTTGIPYDVSNKQMQSIVNLFQETYKKKIHYKIDTEPPERFGGIKELISPRMITVWYKNGEKSL